LKLQIILRRSTIVTIGRSMATGKKVRLLRNSGSSVPCGVRGSKMYCKVKGCKFAPVKDTKVYPGAELQIKSFLICI
jgi:hypothetical protein